MNKRFILKGIISLYQSFNFSQISLNKEEISFNVNNLKTNNWFDMTYDNIYNLAELSHKVYYENEEKRIDISKDNDTVRAYLFSSEDFKTHIISIKGTSTILGKNIKVLNSVYNDKFNDNLFYSCCFYKQSNLFNKDDKLIKEKCWNDEESHNNKQMVFSNKKICKKKCFNAMNDHDLNYITIMNYIIQSLKLNDKYNIDFEKDEILFTGHSLGGTLATIMGVMYNKIAISFQSPGVKNFLENSHIFNKYINKDSYENIYNFGHNADIIFKGKCKGKFSFCYIGGYNIETKCHIGKVCEYDAINKLKISESIFTHRLKYVLDNIIPHWEKDFPECKINNDCKDCEKWTYI